MSRERCFVVSKHGKNSDKDRCNNKTLEDAAFHNANITTDDNTKLLTGKNSASVTTIISALCKAISTQTATNQANFTKMMEILQMQRDGNGGNPRNRN